MALAVRFQWLASGAGEMDEYGSEKSEQWLTFSIDGELASRLQNYASALGVSIEEALLEILDMPLSVYGPDDKISPEFRDELKASEYSKMRMKNLSGRVRVHLPDAPGHTTPKKS